MMMNGRHAEDPLARQLEGADLNDHRDSFEHKDAAHNEKYDLMAGHDRDNAQCSAQCQRADVAHKNHGGVGVEPQKSEASSGDRAAEHHQLAGPGQIGDVQILGKFNMPGEVGDHTETRRHHYRGHDGESIQSICQIHRITRADHHKIAKRHEQPAHREGHIFEEGHIERRFFRQECGIKQIQGDAKGKQRLPQILPPRRQASRVFADHLPIIVNPANRAKGHSGDQRHPDIAAAQICPQQGGSQYGDKNQCAAHGGRAGFLQMRLRPLFTNCLANL